MRFILFPRLRQRLRRRWPFYLVLVVALGGTGFATASRNNEYKSEAVLYVDPVDTTAVAPGDGTAGAIANPAEASSNLLSGLLRTDSFVRDILVLAGDPATSSREPVSALVGAARDAISVEARDGGFMAITVIAGSPTSAQSLGFSTMEAFANWRTATSTPGEAVPADTDPEAADELDTRTTESIVVIDAPSLATEPESTAMQTAFRVLLFGVAGMVAGALTLAIATILDRSVRLPREVRSRLDAETLAIVPRIRG